MRDTFSMLLESKMSVLENLVQILILKYEAVFVSNLQESVI